MLYTTEEIIMYVHKFLTDEDGDGVKSHHDIDPKEFNEYLKQKESELEKPIDNEPLLFWD